MDVLKRDFHPADEERRLREEIEVASKNKDRNKQKLIVHKLVKLYVSQAEYFKMSDKPNPHIAIKYLQKALRIQPDHPVANYRLGFLHYREKRYAKAIVHLERALDGSETEGLNDTQSLLANMFMVNCGIRIAKESITEIQSIEENLYSDLDKDRIEKYRKEILVLDENIFERMFYKQILDGIESRINEVEFDTYQPIGKQLLLRISDDGRELIFPDSKKVNLNPVSFYIFYALLTAKKFLTYKDLKQKIIAWSELEVTEDNIRQILSRFSRNIPFWKEYFQSNYMLSPESNRQVVAYKLAEKFSCCILCRGDEMLPGEY